MQKKLEFDEIWKDIADYDGYYQVSNWGKVRRVDKMINGKGGVDRIRRGRILKQDIKSNGYYMVQLCVYGKEKLHTVHRLLAIAFIPNVNNLTMVNHINGVRTDNRLCNLEWCTASHNITEGFKIRQKNGSNKHPAHKFKSSDILAMRAKYKPRVYTIQMLADEYGIRKKAMEKIIYRKSWRWL